MTKEVYEYILRAYGQSLAQWIGFVLEVIRTLVMRVYIVIPMAQVTVSVAAGDISSAKKYTVYFLLAYIIGSAVGTLGELLSVRTENQQYNRLAKNFYEKLVGKDISFYRDNQTGYLASIYRQHLDSAMTFIHFIRGEALGILTSLIVPPLVLFAASPPVGLVAVFVVVIQVLYISWMSRKVNKYRQEAHELYRKVTGEVSDVITNIISFKAGGVDLHARDNVVGLIDQETVAFYRRRRIGTLLNLPRNVFTALGIASAIYIIISNASALSPASLGLMVLTITYMFQIIRNVSALPDLVMQHDDLITKIFPTLKYLSNQYEEVRDPDSPVKLIINKGEIDIDQVSFSYSSHSHSGQKIPVFKALSIKIKGGEQIGVVGLSGAGKSTLASLLLRFDEVDEGSIRIDGIDIRDVLQSDLRKHIAFVPQEPLLFHRSIKENISYYGEDEDKIVLAAKAAHAHEFIVKLPHSYDTIVGERGVKLSGGQKQRVVIARAMLKRAPIMIFDEATSALDTESEQIIQKALPEIIKNQTAIIIAHRLSTVAGLHRIIVMHEGRIVESGRHEELLELKGRYYSLWQKQTSEFARLSPRK